MTKIIPLIAVFVSVALLDACHTAHDAVPGSPITVDQARNLPPSKLANALLGERLGARVIDVVRHEYDTGSNSVPESVDFYTQPALSWPSLRGICQTDVITVEYNWFDLPRAASSTPLTISHVQASSRYLAVPDPDPDDKLLWEKAQGERAAECAKFKTALAAFRAPSAGDAQWLAAIEREYSSDRQFTFTCDDFADRSCTKAREVLPSLPLKLAKRVESIDCPNVETGDQVNYCYRMVFTYDRTSPNAGLQDRPDQDESEWIASVVAGMRNGMAPVEIRSMSLKHVPRPLVMY